MFKEAWTRILSSGKIALLTHDNPDGDTLGSALGLYRILEKHGKKATVVNFSEKLPRAYDFLYGFQKIKNTLPKHCDLVIYFDCSNKERVSVAYEDIFTINIDHHISNNNFGNINLVLWDAPSTTSVVYKLLHENGIPIDEKCANALYAGLVTDSGFFSYERVDTACFDMASNLVKCGAKPNLVAQNLKEREPLSKIRLLGLVLDSLELDADARVATIFLTEKMMKKSGGTHEDAENFVNFALSLHSVEIAFFIRELNSRSCRISMRTKNEIEADKFLHFLGGGGHKRAAGAVTDGKIVEIKNILIEKVKREFYEKK